MRIGYNEATMKDGSTLEQDLELCERFGFDEIEIRLDMLRAYLKTHTVSDLARFFEKSHLKPGPFNALYTYRELFSEQDDPARREALLEEFLLGCKVGREIGADMFIIVPPMSAGGYDCAYEGSREEIFADCVRILKGLAEIGAPYGMKLCFELVGAAKCSVREIGQADEIVRAVNRDDVGFVFDSCNIYSFHKLNDFSAMANVQPEKLFAVHINDYDDVPEQELCPAVRCLCGDGVIDLENYLSVLKKMDYQGMVSIETFRPEHWAQPAEAVISRAYETTRAILARCGCL